MDFNVKRILDKEELKEKITVLKPAETKKYFDWLNQHFYFPYGQIDWSKVANCKEPVRIDGYYGAAFTNLLKETGIAPDTTLIGIWSDSDYGFKLKAAVFFENPDAFWMPVQHDLWLITETMDGCIELHHESYLASVANLSATG